MPLRKAGSSAKSFSERAGGDHIDSRFAGRDDLRGNRCPTQERHLSKNFARSEHERKLTCGRYHGHRAHRYRVEELADLSGLQNDIARAVFA